jgi:hypothetical protein
MPLSICDRCKCVDNAATSKFWLQVREGPPSTFAGMADRQAAWPVPQDAARRAIGSSELRASKLPDYAQTVGIISCAPFDPREALPSGGDHAARARARAGRLGRRAMALNEATP